MGEKLPPDQMAFYKRVDEILWEDWDPIGISGSENARDEYYGYLPGVFRLALDGATDEAIADRLHLIERENMGLSGNRNHCLWAAQKIVSAKRELIAND